MLKLQSRQRKVNQECYALILKELVSGPCTSAQLLSISGLDRRPVLDLLKCFHAHGLVHIACWTPDALGRLVTPAWSWGNEPDAPRPLAKTSPQSQKKHRDRKRQQKKAAGTVFANAVAALARPPDPLK